MPLNRQQLSTLISAIKEYDYPAKLYDFKKGKEILFNGMRELEDYLKNGLVSNDLETVKFALANIVYWGNINSGYCQNCTQKFLNGITDKKLECAINLFSKIEGDGLKELKKIGLPQFTNMSFISKLRMFLDPETYVTLDRKLLKIKTSGVQTLFDNISEQQTYIPINQQNCNGYLLWCKKCKQTAKACENEEVIAVDVERGIFHMVDEGEIHQAAMIVANMP